MSYYGAIDTYANLETRAFYRAVFVHACVQFKLQFKYMVAFALIFYFLFFFNFFVGHIHMSYFGATGTTVLDFW